MIVADDAALNEAPKTFNRVRMDGADQLVIDEILSSRVIDHDSRIEDRVAPRRTGCPYRSAKDNFSPSALTVLRHKIPHSLARHGIKDARNNGFLATAYRADDGGFVVDGAATGATTFAALVLVPVLRLAAYVGLVHFDDAHKLAELVVLQRRTNAHCHVPSGFERSKAHVAPDLASAHAFLSRQQKVNDAEPVAQILIRVFKDRAGNVGKAIRRAALGRTVHALPFPILRPAIL